MVNVIAESSIKQKHSGKYKNEPITKSKNIKKKRKLAKAVGTLYENGVKKFQKHQEFQNFTLIRDVLIKPKINVLRVLPHWILNPTYIKRNLTSKCTTIKEDCPILKRKLSNLLNSNNIETLFPVQRAIIPEILSGATGVERRYRPRDICVATPTGSGKTLSYVLPVLQAIGGPVQIHAIQALVIVPVVELAKQIFSVLETYAKAFDIKVGRAFGQESLLNEKNELVQKINNKYVCKVDVIVSLPQRLLDHFSQTPGLDFSELRFLILDEADKLFIGNGGDTIDRIKQHIYQFKTSLPNLGLPPFFKETNHFVSLSKESYQRNEEENVLDNCRQVPHCTIPMQRLLFSATLSHNPQQLQNMSLYRPKLFTVDVNERTDDSTIKKPPVNDEHSRKSAAAARPVELTEQYIKMEMSVKPLVVHHLLRKQSKINPNFKAIVFTSTLEATAKLTILLKSFAKSKYTVDEFSSKLKINKNNLRKFIKGSTNVLVASDVVARGIDIPNIDYVISYDVPSSNNYIHRIGRTARAGKLGCAISFVIHGEMKRFRKMVGTEFPNLIEQKIPKEKLERLENRFHTALEILTSSIKQEKYKVYKKIPSTINRNKFGIIKRK